MVFLQGKDIEVMGKLNSTEWERGCFCEVAALQYIYGEEAC
jgi:hypothetical protein